MAPLGIDIHVGRLARAAALVLVLGMAAAQPAAAGWRVQTAPGPGALSGVSCPSAAKCFAVGNVGNATLAEGSNGAHWSIQRTPPVPAGLQPGSLDGVSCTSPVSCVATGNYGDTSGGSFTIAPTDVWNGTRWSLHQSASPGAGLMALARVACPSSTDCIAVGDYSALGSGSATALTEKWNGHSWSILSTPLPAGTSESTLGGVSCSSGTSCTAVGFYTDSTYRHQGLVEHWNGTSWSLQSIQPPTDRPVVDVMLTGVSCPSGGQCLAVGNYLDDIYGYSRLLSERWNGTRWSLLPMPYLAGESHMSLQDVSCASSTSCTAVGSFFGRRTQAVAERYNGSRWTRQSPAEPGSTRGFAAVSCPTATRCTAVGYQAARGHSRTQPLVEQWSP